MANARFFFSSKERATPQRKEAQELGVTGEEMAARYLTDQGLTVVEMNYSNGRHEIDIICLEKGELVVVEVKTRSSEWLHPEEAVDHKKRKALVEAANQYVLERKRTEPVRFDIVAVNKLADGATINHIRNAFDMYSY